MSRTLKRRFSLNAPASAVWALAADPVGWPDLIGHLRTVSVSSSVQGADGWVRSVVLIDAAYQALFRWSGKLQHNAFEQGLKVELAQTDNPFVRATVELWFEPSDGEQPATAVISGRYKPMNPVIGFLLGDKLEGALERLVRRFDEAAMARSNQ